jgi:hypothetical protein
MRAGVLASSLLVATLGLAVSGAARAAQPEVAPQIRSIFQCELNGKKITSDRLIPECVHKEQKELNPDGSLKRLIPPTLTSEELAVKEQQEREAKIVSDKKNDWVRRDRNLMQRFPDEAAHRKAREKALDELRISAKSSTARIALLLTERNKLDEERKFYENEKVKKTLPTTLKQKIDANDAALEAQKALAQGQEAEAERINALYDAELIRLKKLWGGALPGSLGPLPEPKAAGPATLTKAGSE